MTDRELLERAAKAIGMEYNERRTPYPSPALYRGVTGPVEYQGWWNPFKDDGDALRLAVALHMEHCNYGAIQLAAVKVINQWLPNRFIRLEEYYSRGDDPTAATRRAIVRAAAAIGEAMP